jgi:hypothetical protein
MAQLSHWRAWFQAVFSLPKCATGEGAGHSSSGSSQNPKPNRPSFAYYVACRELQNGWGLRRKGRTFTERMR